MTKCINVVPSDICELHEVDYALGRRTIKADIANFEGYDRRAVHELGKISASTLHLIEIGLPADIYRVIVDYVFVRQASNRGSRNSLLSWVSLYLPDL